MTSTLPLGLILGCLVVGGIAVAFIAYFRTPRERRHGGPKIVALDEQLAALPPSAEARIIKGNPRAARRRLIILVSVLITLAAINWLLDRSVHGGCGHFLGVNATFINLVLICYALPGLLFICSLIGVPRGLKMLRTGYYPPLDALVEKDTIATKARTSTLRASVLLVLPLLGLGTLYLGHRAYEQMTHGLSPHAVIRRIEAHCRAGTNDLARNGFGVAQPDPG